MNNEQEIERIATELCKCCPAYYVDEGGSHCIKGKLLYSCNCIKSTAKQLIYEGIGDKKQAVKEAFDKLKSRRQIMTGEFIGDPDWEYVEFDAIDELFTELYGAEK